MLNIGRFNTLKVLRSVDFGYYLDDTEGGEILMPAKFADNPLSDGDEVRVFVYTDSSDRLIATTEKPFAKVGEFAYLQVAEVNRIGAFLDWGLEAKQLLVPYSEQKAKMMPGGIYLVYVYLDNTTRRVVASSKVDKYLGNVLPRYDRGDKVSALITEHTPIGYKCIVDNLHRGMIYQNETFVPLELQNTIEAYVKQVRDDGKIDLSVRPSGGQRTHSLEEQIFEALINGTLSVGEKSSPEEIQKAFGCSKRDFKQAVGHLYKARRIVTVDGVLSLPE